MKSIREINDLAGFDESCLIDQVKYSKRSSIALEVLRSGKVILRVPKHAKEKDLFGFLATRKDWIKNVKAKYSAEIESRVLLSFTEGSLFLFKGKEYSLYFFDRDIPVILFDNAFFLCDKLQSRAKQLFIDWYKIQAERFFVPKIKEFSAKMGCNVKKIKLSNAKGLWGSCNTKGLINLNWRLIMAPETVIEYVVIHELAHLKYPDHSKKFWDYLRVFCPDFKKQKEWLNTRSCFIELW